MGFPGAAGADGKPGRPGRDGANGRNGRDSVAYPIRLAMAGKFELFVNGFSVGAGGDLGHSYSFFPKVTPGRDVVAVSGYNLHGPAAFVGTFGGVETSASDWRCKSFASHVPENWNSNTFDDSSWSRAVSFGRNNDAGTAFYRKLKGYALGIPGNAKWIWAENNSNHKLVVCRCVPSPCVAVLVAASAHCFSTGITQLYRKTDTRRQVRSSK